MNILKEAIIDQALLKKFKSDKNINLFNDENKKDCPSYEQIVANGEDSQYIKPLKNTVGVYSDDYKYFKVLKQFTILKHTLYKNDCIVALKNKKDISKFQSGKIAETSLVLALGLDFPNSDNSPEDGLYKGKIDTQIKNHTINKNKPDDFKTLHHTTATNQAIRNNGKPRIYIQSQSVIEKDIFNSKGEYECLFTCPPYNLKEIWSQDIKNLSCDDWINICLNNFKCKKYIFIVDNTILFKDNIIEELNNKSHFGSNKEYIILIEGKDE